MRDSIYEVDNDKIGYKVVTRINSKSFSPATVSALQSFRYRIDKETTRFERTSGPMALFSSLDDAIDFAESEKVRGKTILKVIYEESEDSSVWKKNPPSFVSNGWGKGYHAESNGIQEKTKGFPRGTIFAESIYPLEVVFER